MPFSSPFGPWRPAARVNYACFSWTGPKKHFDSPARERLFWLCRIRWGAFAGHFLFIAVAFYILNLSLRLTPFILVQAALALTNLGLHLSLRHHIAHLERLSACILTLDVLLLTVLLTSYGGYANPFSMMYLVHVVLASLLLGNVGTWGIATLSGISYGSLFMWYLPLPGMHMHHAESSTTFDLHLHGMLVAFILIACLIAGFISRMRRSVEQSERELTAMRSNEERLIALTQLAAGVAHELGTPLGSAMIVASELRASIDQMSSRDVADELDIMLTELTRCRTILGRMRAESGTLASQSNTDCTVEDLLKSAKALFPTRPISLSSPDRTAIVSIPFDSVLRSLSALISNAIDATSSGGRVSLTVFARPRWMEILVADDGPGMDHLTLKRAGEPFFTTKDPGRGTGLGLFLCRMFATRAGGNLQLSSKPGHGTVAILTIPQ
ncbi:sensor histidine kinase [Lacipirellula parvula]|nr:ATP-binding protein [Lacipirellula parvula]